MNDMIFSICLNCGIRWEGWRFGNFTHTKFRNCGGINCQQEEEEEEKEETT